MARRSHFDWTQDHIEEILKFEKPPGKPLVAFLIGRFQTLDSALRFWQVDVPRTQGNLHQAFKKAKQAEGRLGALATGLFIRGVPAGPEPKQKLERAMKAFERAWSAFLAHRYASVASSRRDAAKKFLAALSVDPKPPFDGVRTEALRLVADLNRRAQGSAAETSAEAWLANEVEREILPLIDYFAAPRRFFTEIVHQIWPRDFITLGAEMPPEDPLKEIHGHVTHLPQTLAPGEDTVEVALTRCLWRWGPGVLNNPYVRKTADSIEEQSLVEILSIVQGKVTFRDGRPKGSLVTPEDAAEAYRNATEYVDGLPPRELAVDHTIYGYGAKPREAPQRNPSKDSAARQQVCNDLEISRRTLRSKLKETDPD